MNRQLDSRRMTRAFTAYSDFVAARGLRCTVCVRVRA